MPAMPHALESGSQAPDFEAVDDGGATRRLSDYRGRTVVLYFYPKDNTSGCTKEACDFRDLHAEFAARGCVVLGVSPDSPKSHQGFKAKHKLPFPLLADEDRLLCKAYGVWKEKAFMGRRYMGVERTTFVIGPDGRVASAERKVSVPGHAKAVLESVRAGVAQR